MGDTWFNPAPDPDDVTVEMIDALETVRSYAERFKDNTSVTGLMEMSRAVLLLDEACFFAPIDEAVDREDERYAHLMAGLRGVDLNDRYPKGDENGIIGRAGEGPGFLRSPAD